MSNVEVMEKGITCLLQGLGAVDTERFIALIIQEKFDYTKWQREHFDKMSSDEFYTAAVEYSKQNPFKVKE